MDVRYFGKGYGWFMGLNVSYWGRFLAFSFEPYWLKDDNHPVTINERPRPFTHLNDVPIDKNSPFVRSGFREAQLYLHYKGLGFGVSNASLWWGPGIHNTLSMTNNTVGFPHVMLGTLKEIRWRNVGINGRYTFARMNDEKGYRAIYFTALTGTMTLYTEPIITVGFSRNYLSGGLEVEIPWTAKKAMRLVFEGLFIENLLGKKYTVGGHDPWDQTLSGYFTLTFPQSGLKLFWEIGINDHRQNKADLRVQPDHAMASIVGLRKYGLFGNENLLGGFEYTNLILGRFWYIRATPNWYDRAYYDDFSYENRRWAAHSGSDSDDFLIYFGYQSDRLAFIPAFNYERHGVIYKYPAEVKLEFRLDVRYHMGQWRVNAYFEHEYFEHIGFVDVSDNLWSGKYNPGSVRRTNTFIIGLERSFDF